MLYNRARLGSDADSKNLHADRTRKQSQLIADASSQSIVSTMDRFVKAVNEMNTQVILPTKLLDVEESPGDDVPVMLRGGNSRYDFYQCLNVIKKDLVLGLTSTDEDSDDDSHSSPQRSVGPTRRHSTACIAGPRPQLSDSLPTRKISLHNPSMEYCMYNLSRQDSIAALTSGQRQDSWASLKPIPEQQQQQQQQRPSRRKSGLASLNINTIPEQQQPQQPARRKSGLASVNMNLISEEQPQQPARRKSGLAAVNMRPEFHLQVSYDSGAECEEDTSDVMSPIEVAEQLREHLQGLQIGLNHLTNTANYITKSTE